MKVLKFGGSSVANSERIREVKKIALSESIPLVVVVSAFRGVTDTLKSLSESAASHDPGYRARLEDLINKHIAISNELLSGEKLDSTLSRVREIFNELSETLNGLFLLRELSRFSLDKALSAGERASSTIISAFFEPSVLVDAREFIRTDDNFGNANVDFTVTNPLVRKKILRKNRLIVVPGFIAGTEAGETTTLGRGGSDYTAAIIAAAINADMLEIWTDTDGFMTADPRKVEKAYAIESLTYSEAIELSHFGAKVIYTPTLRPVYKKMIPVAIKNSYNPGARGTIISSKPSNGSRSPIKGISSIDHIDLITLQGPSMVGVSGISMRLFGSLARKNVSIILITQASSEYSITFAVNPPDSKLAVEAINQEFEREITFRKELKIVLEKDLSIIAIVGEKMKNTPGISAILFRSLGRNGINVIATAQGSSELNISVVIRNDRLRKALNVIHDGFFLSKYKELHLFIAGTGFVGSSLVKQLCKQQQTLLREYNLNVISLGLSTQEKCCFQEKQFHLRNAGKLLTPMEKKVTSMPFLNILQNST